MSILYQAVAVTGFYQNLRIFVNDSTKEAVVSDPGGNVEHVYESLKEAGITIKAILLTHMHLDHVGQADVLYKLTGAKIYGPSVEDKALYDKFDWQSQMLGLPMPEPFETEYLKDGDEITPIEGFTLKVLHTPGHTPGGVSYYCEQEKFVITGDTLFEGSVGRSDFPLGNTDDLINGIKEKLYTLPEDTQVLPGHGPDTTIGEEKQSNPYTV
ncbi:MAG: MBL fold metallo-hydrolase [Succinivibrio sp.]